MPRRVVCLALLFVVVVNVGDAEAQIRRRIRDLRAALTTPPADAAATSPPAPLPLRGGFIARRLQMRRDLVAQQAAEAEPTPAPPAPPQQPGSAQSQAYAQRPQWPPQRQALASQQQPFQALRQTSAAVAPTIRPRSRQEIMGMNLPQLQTTLSDTSAALANELDRFSSAASWQGFLNLPQGIVDEPTVDIGALQTTLSRFEKVAHDRRFAQIASLQSFQQTRTMLTELLNRADMPVTQSSGDKALTDDGPQLIAPGANADPQPVASTAEPLAAPVPQLPRNEGEHSILLRAGS